MQYSRADGVLSFVRDSLKQRSVMGHEFSVEDLTWNLDTPVLESLFPGCSAAFDQLLVRDSDWRYHYLRLRRISDRQGNYITGIPGELQLVAFLLTAGGMRRTVISKRRGTNDDGTTWDTVTRKAIRAYYVPSYEKWTVIR